MPGYGETKASFCDTAVTLLLSFRCAYFLMIKKKVSYLWENILIRIFLILLLTFMLFSIPVGYLGLGGAKSKDIYYQRFSCGIDHCRKVVHYRCSIEYILYVKYAPSVD